MCFYKPYGSVDGDADKRRLTWYEAVGVALLSDLRHRLVRCFFTFGLVVGYLEFNHIVVVVFYNLDITASVIAVIFSHCRKPRGPDQGEQQRVKERLGQIVHDNTGVSLGIFAFFPLVDIVGNSDQLYFRDGGKALVLGFPSFSKV